MQGGRILRLYIWKNKFFFVFLQNISTISQYSLIYSIHYG